MLMKAIDSQKDFLVENNGVETTVSIGSQDPIAMFKSDETLTVNSN